MGLKKIFPIILVLISLSLIGIIVIQISWILTMLENKREDLHHKMIDAVVQVGQQLVEQRGKFRQGPPAQTGNTLAPIRSLPDGTHASPAHCGTVYPRGNR